MNQKQIEPYITHGDISETERSPLGQVSSLDTRTAQRVRDSVPESTRRAYASAWRRFTIWCAAYHRLALAATAETVADYASHLADEHKAPSTIEREIAAITAAHRAAGLSRPDTTLARAVLRAYKRERATNPGLSVRKAAPVTIDKLRLMVDALDITRVMGLRDRAILVIGFALGARRSEIAALDVADCVFSDQGVEIRVRVSKTDKDSVGRHVALPYGAHPSTCPVRTLQAWLRARAAGSMPPETGALFVRIDRYERLGHVATGRGSADGRLSGQAIAQIVTRTAIAAGLDARSCWSGHSLRRGFATEAHKAGHSPLRIARHGGWKDGSPVLLGYIEEVERWQANPLVGVGL